MVSISPKIVNVTETEVCISPKIVNVTETRVPISPYVFNVNGTGVSFSPKVVSVILPIKFGDRRSLKLRKSIILCDCDSCV